METLFFFLLANSVCSLLHPSLPHYPYQPHLPQTRSNCVAMGHGSSYVNQEGPELTNICLPQFLYYTWPYPLSWSDQWFLFIYFETGLCVAQACWVEAGLEFLILLHLPSTMSAGSYQTFLHSPCLLFIACLPSPKCNTYKGRGFAFFVFLCIQQNNLSCLGTKKIFMRGWDDCSVVLRASCCFRGPMFGSRHPSWAA